MPVQVLFVQGGGEGTHDSWDDKLVDSLRQALGDDYAVLYPEMPDEADPQFAPWAEAIRTHFETMRDGDVLVGHSLGGLILLHVLAETPPPFTPGGLFLLAAPFIGEGGWPSDDIAARTDFATALPSGVPVHLYHGTADDTVPFSHAALYKAALPDAIGTAITGGDHQFGNDLAHVAQDIMALPSPGACSEKVETGFSGQACDH